jgi:hypothetical protein
VAAADEGRRERLRNQVRTDRLALTPTRPD